LVSRRGRYGGTFVSDLLPRGGYSGLSGVSALPLGNALESNIEDVLGLRDILEVGAARAAAGRELSESDRTMLRGHLAETQAASADDYRRFDSRLHLAIAEVAGTPSLVPLIADNRTAVNDLLDRIPLIGRNIEHSNQQHEKIVAAIVGGNPLRAAEAMREHLAGSAALLRGFLA
jgi:DNA-binding FadR family transcriptional regulator